MRVALSIFDRTGNSLKPWRDAGYECWAVDIQHKGREERDGIVYIGADLRDWIPPHRREYAVCLAWPPCTHLAVSGARWFSGKGLGALRDSIDLFSRAARICEALGVPYLIENPVSTIATYWRGPDYRFNPNQYALYAPDPDAEAYTKETWLWTGRGFVMPPCRGVEPVLGSKMHLLSPGPERADLRSATPEGFARAVFEANHQMREVA
jgi:hypothetical protein